MPHLILPGDSVLDLRSICTGPADCANPIEPSSAGGAKIAAAIAAAVTAPPAAAPGATLLRGEHLVR